MADSFLPDCLVFSLKMQLISPVDCAWLPFRNESPCLLWNILTGSELVKSQGGPSHKTSCPHPNVLTHDQSRQRKEKKNDTQLSEAFSACGGISMKDYSNRVRNFRHWLSLIYFIVQTCLAGWTGKCGERPRSVNDEGWLHLRIPQKRSNPVLIAPWWPIAVKQQCVSLCIIVPLDAVIANLFANKKYLYWPTVLGCSKVISTPIFIICFLFRWFYFNFKLCKKLLGQLSIKVKYRHIY